MSGPWEDFAKSESAPWEDFAPAKEAPKAYPKIGQPEELSWLEKLAAKMPNSISAMNVRGSPLGRVAKGMADPGAALVQLAANAVGAGEGVNKAVADREAEYQEARKQAGSEGFDPLRLAGNVATTALVPVGAGAGVVRGAATGAGFGAVQPVVDGKDFWGEKLAQTAAGAATGAVMSPILGALARVVSPKASTNPDLALLSREGVKPTIGQAAGGWANMAEEKAMSMPIVGDMIARARRGAVEDFNEAVINKAVQPIGGSVKGAGHEAIAEAGDQLSAAYQKALGSVNHVNFTTPTFATKLLELEKMATGLMPGMREKFTSIIDDVIGTKMSPNGSILGADLKAVDSKLGKLASDYRRTQDPFTRELGDAVLQLKTIVMDEVRTAAPTVAKQLKDADRGWSWLTRVEGAGKRAVNREGIFTPGQWNMTVRGADKSVRGRATARGEALGQDIGEAAQNVLGNRYPDSGTAGRLAWIGGTAAGVTNPIPTAAATAAGSLFYSRPVQNALVKLLTERPAAAPAVANYLRRLQTAATMGAVPLVEDLR